MSFHSLLVLALALATSPLHATAEKTPPWATRQLLNVLLNREPFSSYIAPQENKNSQVSVTMANLSLDFDFSSRSRMLILESPVVLRWNDPRLVWDASKYGNVQQLTGIECWRPLIHYINSVHEFKLNCDKIKVRHTGDVECLSHLHFELTCHAASSSFFTPEQFTCYYGLSWWARINLTCEHAPIDECFNISQFASHALYRVENNRHAFKLIKEEMTGDYYYVWYLVTVTQRSSVKATFLLSILVLGCLVLLQSLLVMNFRERVFLQVLFSEGALVLLYSLEGIPGVRQGEGPPFLRSVAAVLILNSGLMVINVVFLAVTARPGATSQAVAAALASWVDRLHLSFLWPSSSRVAEAEGDWVRLGVVFDRLLFLLSTAILAIVVFVP